MSEKISTLLNDVFDYSLSSATIHTIFMSAVEKVQQLHVTEDLSNIQVTANDELFHRNKPILTGIDTQSLYCYLLIGVNSISPYCGLPLAWILEQERGDWCQKM